MRKYLLLAGAALLGLSGSAYAAIDCAVPPTCDEMGYQMNPDECATDDVLKCPFDDGKVFCFRKGPPGEAGVCKVGSVLYNDLKCYDTPPADKTAIAVVFDALNQLAISIVHYPNSSWGPWKPDIASLTNCGTFNYNSCGTNGKNNTQKIVEELGADSSSAGMCYQSRMGSLAEGSWFLPSASELITLWNNKDAVNTALQTIGGTAILNDYDTYYWSSNESGEEYALALYTSRGRIDSEKKSSGSGHYVRCAVAY